MEAKDHLEREYLEIRHRILNLAASLDRIERAKGYDRITHDRRWKKLHSAAQILIDSRPDRATRIQMLFSDPYDPNWRKPNGASDSNR